MGIENNSYLLDRFCNEFQAIWIVDASDLSMTIFRFNELEIVEGSVDIASHLTNYEEARRWYIDEIVSVQDKKRLLEKTDVDYVFEQIKDGKTFSVEYSRIKGDIRNYNQLFYTKVEPNDQPMEHFVLGFRDIDVRHKIERDLLTGVYGRQFFFDKAEKLLGMNPVDQYDLLISDIVGFKNVNDQYGTEIGDEVLRWYGSFISKFICDDIIIGRYAGDQFAVVCKHDFMQKIIIGEGRRRYEGMKFTPNLPTVTVKYGVYENINNAGTIVSICDKAHIALNKIKHIYGTNIAYYDEKLRKQNEIERNIEDCMNDALMQGQFKVYYQPKHDSVTDKLVGAEALIRWIHPEYGFMSPADFIPLFEQNRFIVNIDYYVWEQTCKNQKKWKELGLDIVPVSVNASKLTFAQDDLIDYLQSKVEQYDVDPNMMHLEITETLMTENIEKLVEKLNQIKELGYKIELDDFGSGYSSLNVLSALPLDVVKLDMSFMRDFGDTKRTKVLNACVKLAKDLGYKTVSEGVENEMQKSLLSILGADAIQGYVYSKPMPQEEFEEYICKYMR